MTDAPAPLTENQPGNTADGWTVYGERLHSRLFIGSALFPSPDMMQQAIRVSGAQVVTVSLRRQSPEQNSGNAFWNLIRELDLKLLPNTAGCHSADEAVTLAKMSRELFQTDWIKLEVIGDDYNLQPDPVGLIEATRRLVDDGFKVFPYCTDDLVLCRRLMEAGCDVVMPWAAPIGTGRGVMNPYALETIRARLPETLLIVDAGIGKPSHACQVMELGYDAVMLNTAVAKAIDPVSMATAFGAAISAGRTAYVAGTMPERQTAAPSTPTIGTPFWHQMDE